MSSEENLQEDSTSCGFELIYPRTGSKIMVDEEPAGRSGHSMVADDSNLYVFGGYNPGGRVLNQGQPAVLDELWKFNFATEKWSKIESTGCPNTCASSCLLMHRSKLFVFGGTSYPFGQRSGNKLFVCDLEKKHKLPSVTGCGHFSVASTSGGESSSSGSEVSSQGRQWEVYPQDEPNDDVNTPPRGYGQSVVFHGRYLYSFGGAVGFYNEAIGDLYRLDLDTLTWEKLSPTGESPDGRYKQEIIQDSQGFFVMGGGRLHTALPVHILYHYSFSDNAWTKVTTFADPTSGLPRPRSAFGFVQVDRNVYICGGTLYGVNNQPHQVLQDIWRLSLNTFRWTSLSASLPEPVYFHRVTVSPSNHLYMYGGVATGGRRSTKLYRYRLPFQISLLSELCWSKVCLLWKDGIGNTDPQELIENYGIPRKFVQRLS